MADRIKLVTEARRIAAAHETRPRGAAIGSGDVARREADAVRGDRVDMRGRNLVIALTADLAVAEIVHQNDDDIRPARLCGFLCMNSPGTAGDGEDKSGGSDTGAAPANSP